MKKILLRALWILVLFPLTSWASHIVGGEIEFYPTNRSANRFYIGLNFYFDQANGRTGAETSTVILYFYRKSDNAPMGNIELPQTTRKLINYTNPTCSNANTDLRTLLLRYSSEIVINTQNFNDPKGYYIVWERCCRNSIITNITNPASTGETFYTEFPALVQNNLPYVNSSPKFGELKGDYICLNRPFVFDFSGTDADGDSLVYSLSKPWAGYAGPNNPEPIARGASSYPEVNWAPGITNENMIPGPRPLTINRQTGVLSVTADKAGLYVFAVLVEEYRKGVKIGATRREFQLKAVDCPLNRTPVALYRETGKRAFYKEGETLTIKKDQAKCLDIMLTDGDPNQRLTIKTVGINFDDKSVVANPVSFITTSATDTLKAQICFEKCVESRNNQPVILEVIVSDDGCPQPLTDTLRIRVIIEGSTNNNPDVTTDLSNNRATIPQGTTLNFKVTGIDLDNDDLVLEAKGRDFQLAAAGMTFNNATGKGSVTQPFTWTPPCTATNREYIVDFIVTDVACNKQVKDTVSVRLQSTAKPNNAPDVSTSLTSRQPIDVPLPSVDAAVLGFDVFGDDLDKTDQLRLYAQPKGFTLAQYGMKFSDKTGAPRLVSRFEWEPSCTQYTELSGKELTVNFITEDNSCGPVKTDTVAVVLRFGDLPSIESLDKNIPNVITPNNDGKNDCFFLESLSVATCGPQFLQVDIYSRWGKLIFTSTDRKFKWCAEGVPTGQYYYGLKFTDRTFKGTMTVIK
ncbi:T9SS type B sorting domain-containing protein [Runella sp. CRIBMP]|uniref:T9SS type B sorting domain-containing protein n=1 Tax=Runella sp. CRIBMP TaxID=2683261 RepID=UPI00141366F0|nr:gliding motility-associated C-terminal domain-containing protein [Runella sp. CRIBMP]NBB20422.1 T9SS type B sorting domain-containing protein [Runella sp. CRIBMP]